MDSSVPCGLSVGCLRRAQTLLLPSLFVSPGVSSFSSVALSQRQGNRQRRQHVYRYTQEHKTMRLLSWVH